MCGVCTLLWSASALRVGCLAYSCTILTWLGIRYAGATSLNMAMDKSGRAPVITVFDHRGCTAHKNTDYTGPKANGMEDEQCVKVQSVKIAGPDADTVLRDSLATLKK